MKVYHLRCGYGVSAEGEVRDGICARRRSDPKPIRMDTLIDMGVTLGACTALVLGVVHRELRIDVAEISLMSVRIYMILAVKTIVAVAVFRW